MDEITSSIKDYALIIDTTLDASDDLLDFVVDSVIDRALIYTNRYQLVEGYEEALAELEEDEELDSTVDVPIPTPMERVLADVVVRTYRTMVERNTAETNAISSMSDNGQSVAYSDQLKSYLNGASDTDIFAGATEMLKRYRLPDVIEHTKYF